MTRQVMAAQRGTHDARRMRAIVIEQYGGPEVLTQRDVADPVPASDEVLIRVKAFGLNHAECYMRSGAWGEVARITGIEAVGLVEADPSGALPTGTRVLGLLGGLGRTRDGSYAELVTVPASNVAVADTDLDWPRLAAIPEAYATAWSALHRNLAVQAGQRLLVRGATSAVGQATVQLGVAAGATVLATTRTPTRIPLLHNLGADEVLVDDGQLPTNSVDAVVDLVGNATLRDSLRCARPGGHVVQLGFLGGLAPVDAFNPITDLPTGVHLSFYGSAFVLGSPAYPLDEIPFTDIFRSAAGGILQADPARVFTLDEIVEAHQTMESGTAGGKLVVVL
jgi:NADPH:quinone reductase-like Zn-dependent oxidoreductase